MRLNSLSERSKSSDELSKSGQGFDQGQKWSWGAGHVQGVGSRRDTSQT